ncbi:MAG: hypothetical protein JXJ04_02395 [Spirochaetales bacterium]|nr:hypothetical protein [Spirochaetales bacterium]
MIKRKEKIGDFMIRIGALTPEQVKDILRRQKELEPHKLFGKFAVELGYLNNEALDEYIRVQEEIKKQELAGT